MDQAAEHSTTSAQPEGLLPPPDSLEGGPESAPAQGVGRPLFWAVSALAGALAALCVWLALRCAALDGQGRYARQLAGELDAQRTGLEQAQAQLSAAQAQLKRLEGELDQARSTIGLLEEYSIAAPDGTTPEKQ